MRAVCYLRVSSAGQAEKGTIQSQFRDLPAFVLRQGWTLVKPIGTYVDDGHTAKAGHLGARAGFAALARDAALGLFDVVVVVDLDRLTRSEDLAERGAILGAFQRAGVKIAVANTGQMLDLSSSMGDLLSLMGGFFAAEENRKRRVRAKGGRRLAISRGRLPAGKTPYGLAFSTENGWSIHPVNGPIAIEILTRLAAGHGTGAIARDFRERGAALPQQGTWTRSKIWHIATRPHYTGTWLADSASGTTVKIPALVDEETWKQALGGLEDRRNKGRKTKHSYLLEKLAICAECGARVRIQTDKERRWSRYTCRIASSNGQGTCRAAFRVVDVDARVWAAISRDLADPQLAERIVAGTANLAGDAETWRRDAAEYRRKLTRLENEVEPTILERFRRGKISAAAMDRELTALSRERRALERQLQTARAAVRKSDIAASELGEVNATLDHLRGALAATTDEERAQLVRSLVAPGGIILGEKIQIQLRIPAPGQRGSTSGQSAPPSNQRGGGGADAGTPCLASGSACSSETPECFELRVVA